MTCIGGVWASFGDLKADIHIDGTDPRRDCPAPRGRFDALMSENPQSDYSRAVLSIETPVSVTLASKRVSLERIVNLVPGAMLSFDAHCDEPLTLEAGGKPIATGETVKIGDKFGLRVREILHQPPAQQS